MLVNDYNRECLIKSMARHFAHQMTEDELRKNIEGDPSILEDYAEWRMNYEDDRKECRQ